MTLVLFALAVAGWWMALHLWRVLTVTKQRAEKAERLLRDLESVARAYAHTSSPLLVDVYVNGQHDRTVVWAASEKTH